jgi:arabinose-5-phosphate isomerase
MQKEYITSFFNSLDLDRSEDLISILEKTKGLIFFCGIGKSGFIAEKIAMTFVSLGIKAFYMSATNALHGDIGIVSDQDTVIFLSKSGETKELLDLFPFIKEKGAYTVSWICRENSSLEKLSDFSLILPLKRELCLFDLSPTTSSAIQLLFGDTVAVELMKRRKLTLEEYGKNHPAGLIGRTIRNKVEDVMIKGEKIPTCYEDDFLKNVLVEFSRKKCGCVIVLSRVTNHVVGVFTDGDLRRALERNTDHLLEEKMQVLMTRTFLSVQKNTLLKDAAATMQKDENKWVSTLPVLEKEGLVGLIRMHDIINL